MLEKETIARVSYLTVIGFLMACLVIAAYLVADYNGEIRSANIIASYTKRQNEDLKESLKSYAGALQYYQNILSSGFRMQKDGSIFLKKGTLIIPPVPEVKEEKVRKAT